jgi:ubiquinone/menaquinone biosynthesis C-methylase UbiE
MRDDRIKIVSEIIKKQDGNWLNIGVGEGILEKKVTKNKEKDVYGLDITIEGLLHAKSYSNFSPICGSVNNLPVKSNSIDTVTCLEVIEHLLPEQTFYALHEIRRILKKKGSIIISIPINEQYSNSSNPNRHMRRYTRRIIEMELKISKFNIKKIHSLYAFNNYYCVKKILSSTMFKKKWKPNNLIIYATKQ